MLSRDRPSVGFILCQHGRRLKPSELPLAGTGVKVASGEKSDDGWVLELKHPRWGKAQLIRDKQVGPPPAEDLSFMVGLDKEQLEEIKTCTSVLVLRVVPTSENVLIDRKFMLRFAAAIMGSQATAFYDLAAYRVWTSDDPADELDHDAPLDISSLFVIHCVIGDAPKKKPKAKTKDGDEQECEPITWMHTHGLAALGGFDIDVLRPHPDTHRGSFELFTSLAYAMLEGEIRPDSADVQLWAAGGPVDMVPAEEFEASGHAADRALRSHDEAYSTNRSVLCEPRGFAAKLLRRPRKAARAFTKPGIDEAPFAFSTETSQLMAQRAKATLSQLRAVAKEFADLSPTIVLKLGVPWQSDEGSSLEHMWFEVHAIEDDAVEATLLNEPLNVQTMHAGDRGHHPLEWLTDWQVLLPVGRITPRMGFPARMLRQNPKIRAVLRELKELRGGEQQE